MRTDLISDGCEAFHLGDERSERNVLPNLLFGPASVFFHNEALHGERGNKLGREAVRKLPQSISRLRIERKPRAIDPSHELKHAFQEASGHAGDGLANERNRSERAFEFGQIELHALNPDSKIERPEPEFDKVDFVAGRAVIAVAITP